jgi:hypothetical protein
MAVRFSALSVGHATPLALPDGFWYYVIVPPKECKVNHDTKIADRQFENMV